MKKNLIIVLFIIAGISCTNAQTYQLDNAGFEYWDTDSFSLPLGWNSYNSSVCQIVGLPSAYSKIISDIIHSTSVHDRSEGCRPGGSGKSYLTLQTRNVNGGGISMAVSGLVSNGRFNIGSISVFSPLNYFSTERTDSRFCHPLQATPDSLYLWVKYYAVEADTSRARIVAYIHGDTDFQYMNHIQDSSLYTACINYLLPRTDTLAPATHWTQLKIPFSYSGTAEPRYILIYLASDSSILGGHIGNELSVDDIELIYSSWLNGIQMDSLPLAGFEKSRLSYDILLPAGTPADYVPEITYTKEVSDIYDTLVYTPSEKGVDGATAEIRLTAEDGVSNHVYTLHFTVQDTAESIADFGTGMFRTYPNPANAQWNIRIDKQWLGALLQLYAADGRKVLDRILNEEETVLSLDGMPQGVYLYRVLCGGQPVCSGNLVRQ